MSGDLRAAMMLGAALLGLASGFRLRAADVKKVIAHRGASGYAPEHTLAAYQLALEQHADFVEQDLAVTRDGILISLHDDSLDRTTNVADVFPTRFAAEIPGRSQERHWLANDFTLAELRQLDAGFWFDPRFAGARIVTWQEAIDLVRGKAGLYPELKSPAFYAARGVDMVQLFADSVRKNGLDRPASLEATPLVVQSFDEATIRRIATELPSVPRTLLMDSFDEGGLTDARLGAIAAFATGIGPAKRLVERQPDVIARAHAAGLTVTVYTFRAGSSGRFPTVRDEMSHFLYTLGIDALFTDNPDQFPRRP